MKTPTVIVWIVLMAMLLAACGGGTSGPKNNGDAAGDKNAELTVIKIATQSPLSGGIAVLGEAIKLGAQMAMEDVKAEFEALGYELQLVPYDDQADPQKGVANAELVGADKSILAVVGHLNSGVSIPSSAVYEKYGIAMVSPASTATDVTDRGLKAVNRIVARDDFQGPAGADYAVNTLKAKKIFVIQDKTAYGQGLADAFKTAAEDLGAEISGYEGITVGEKDFSGVLNQISLKNPDLIYFGGMYSEGGTLIRQARDKGIKAPFMGGDGLDSSALVEIAGEAVVGTLYTSVATDITKSDSGKQWADNYSQKFKKNVESYSVYGYDAMAVVLKGLKSAIEAGGGQLPSREQVRDAVRGVKDYEGIATKVSFDDKGDNDFAKIFIYKFDNAAYPGALISEVSK